MVSRPNTRSTMTAIWFFAGTWFLPCVSCNRSDEPQAPMAPPNVLWIVWDTVRSDHLSLYGFAKATTPYLDEWAKGARVFKPDIPFFDQKIAVRNKMATATPTRIVDIAMGLAEAELSVIPVRTDGSKAPAIKTWAPYQDVIATPEEISRMFGRNVGIGIGIVGGKASNNLEILDFDKVGIFEQFSEGVEWQQPGLIEKLPAVRTPSGGTHLYFRCEQIEGNQKLAMWPGEDGKVKAVIETRGEGGFIVSAPSHGKVHQSGRPYGPLTGGPESVGGGRARKQIGHGGASSKFQR